MSICPSSKMFIVFNCVQVSAASFRQVALALRYDYMLGEYSNLSDAWRVYQGVAFYREYRGIGAETRNINTEPRYSRTFLYSL